MTTVISLCENTPEWQNRENARQAVALANRTAAYLRTIIVVEEFSNHQMFLTMADNNRNKDQNLTGGNQDNRGGSNTRQSTQTGAGQNTENLNPQKGSDWNNYRSRELSDQGGGAGNATTPKTKR